MKKYIGGYSILDLASTTIYADALGALKQDKPVLVYDTPECYFADTIKATTIDDEPVIQITKGGKTITIANDNTITNVGDIQTIYHRYMINMILNDSQDGTGDDFDLYFQVDTNYELPLFTNEPLTVTKANLIKNYRGIIAYDNQGETIQGFNDEQFIEGNPFSFRPVGDLYIYANSTITIKEIF